MVWIVSVVEGKIGVKAILLVHLEGDKMEHLQFRERKDAFKLNAPHK